MPSSVARRRVSLSLVLFELPSVLSAGPPGRVRDGGTHQSTKGTLARRSRSIAATARGVGVEPTWSVPLRSIRRALALALVSAFYLGCGRLVARHTVEHDHCRHWDRLIVWSRAGLAAATLCTPVLPGSFHWAAQVKLLLLSLHFCHSRGLEVVVRDDGVRNDEGDGDGVLKWRL